MKLFGKAILVTAACIMIGSAVSAAAHVVGPAAYYSPYPYYAPPYYAPSYPVYVSESYGYVRGMMTRYFTELPAPVRVVAPRRVPAPVPYAYAAPYPAVTHVPYGIHTYPVYDVSMGYVHAPRPAPVIFPTYWRQSYHWW